MIWNSTCLLIFNPDLWHHQPGGKCAEKFATEPVAPPIVDTGLGGDKRSEGTANNMMVTPEAFATEALAQLEAGNDEVLVGVSVQTRKLGEAMFERMNSRS
ncbi:hypothetical protein [Rhizobium sp. NZLR10]|uniref:hypothetical protein n=1 Tax=Rhizobium sp. NZLR10 TaxID=2731097 RepID=UPI002180B6DE|nr:hypothetical protein [Rhizobium sp. NZLR10]